MDVVEPELTLPGGGPVRRKIRSIGNIVKSISTKLRWLWELGQQKLPTPVKNVFLLTWRGIVCGFWWILRSRPVRWLLIFIQGYIVAWIIFHGVLGFLGLPFIKIGNFDHLKKLDYYYEMPIPPLDPGSNVVTVDIYDLWWTWIPFNNLMIKYKGGCWHSEINVYDRVFRYAKEPPKDDAGWVRKDLEYSDMAYRGRITLGTTDWTKEEIDRLYIQKNTLSIWRYENHEVLMNNCNDVSFWLADKLGFGEEWPLWLDAFPKWYHRSLMKYVESTWLVLEQFSKFPFHPRPFKVFADWFTGKIVDDLYYHKHPVIFSSDSVNKRHEKLTGEVKFPGGKPRSDEKVDKWRTNKRNLADVED